MEITPAAWNDGSYSGPDPDSNRRRRGGGGAPLPKREQPGDSAGTDRPTDSTGEHILDVLA